MLSDYPRFAELALPDQLRLTALEAEDRLPVPMLDAIQRAAGLLEEVGWAIQPPSDLDDRLLLRSNVLSAHHIY